MEIPFLNIDFSTWTTLEYVIGSVLTVCFIYQLYFAVRYLAGVNRYSRHLRRKQTQAANAATCSTPTEDSTTTALPSVSVLVCARNEAYNLETFLTSLLEQDYPDFEVIVVNDGSEDSTQEVLERLCLLYKNLHITFVPQGARVGSTKKLALTLAAKAAHNDILLLTDADCRPVSPQWIRHIASAFDENTEIVLGYSAYFEKPTMLSRLISYDTLFNGLQYLGMALSRHPYMGVGRNLAYRRQTFFNHKGFAGMLGVKAGDDDLFVNRIATRHNTRVVVDADSVVWSVPKSSFPEWHQQKERHLSVSPLYKASSKLRLTLEPVTRGLLYAAAIAAAFIPNPLLWTAAGVTLVSRWIWLWAIINRSARHFRQRRTGIELILFDIFLPLNNLCQHITLALFPKRHNRW